MEKLLKENLVYILIVIILFAGGAYYSYVKGMEFKDNFTAQKEKQELLKSEQERLDNIIRQKAAARREEKKEKKVAKSGKVIYEVLGQQFSPEASFGIMFDNLLANMTNSGLKIHDIEYNYSPVEDKILQTNAPEYNACELSFVTVSSYSQLQSFFKNIAKENYLTSISEVYLEPYAKDKSILIASFKIRLYTKTI